MTGRPMGKGSPKPPVNAGLLNAAAPLKSDSRSGGETPKLKFCGLSRPEDIIAANALMPDYIGFVFAPKSKRYVSPQKAQELKKLLAPGIRAVGVFVDEDPHLIVDLIKNNIIDIPQLHGSEDENYINELRGRLNELAKALPADNTDTIPAVCNASLQGAGRPHYPIFKAFKVRSEETTEYRKLRNRNFRTYNVNTSGNGLFGMGSIAHFPVTAQGTEQLRSEEDIEKAVHSSADMILLDSSIPGSGQTFDWELIRTVERPYLLAGGLDLSNVGEAIERLRPYGIDVSSGIETDGVKDEAKMAAFAAAVRKGRYYDKP